MFVQNRFFLFGFISALILTGVWAVAQQTGTLNEAETPSGEEVTPSDFDPSDPRQVPETTVIDIDFKGIARYGEIFMIEGLESNTQVISDGNRLDAGVTTFPTLVIHGIFTEQMRDWRDDVIEGNFQSREIEIDLINSTGSRALRIRVLDAFPISFSFPPLNVDGSTRYMERMEFVYDRFEITN